MRWLVLVLAYTACGRVGFDAPASDAVPDVELGHDEDEDGVADLDDVCPHLAGTQDDSDGDRIGDDCDPEPSNPRQQVVLFATMQPGDQPLAIDSGTWTQLADALRFDGNVVGVLRRSGNLRSARMAIGVDIEAVLGATAQHQLSLGASPNTSPDYFVELNEIGVVSQASITEFNNGAYTPLATAPLATGMHPGRATLQGTQDAGTRMTTMTGGWDGEPYRLMASTPGYVGAVQFQIAINNLVCEVRYVWIVEW